MSTLSPQDAATAPMACRATTRVRSTDSARLPVSARQHGAASRRAGCELVAGHDDSHMTFVATSEGYERWWWLRWGPRAREVLQIDPCAAERTGAHPDDCLLPERHLGPHSFELRPAGKRHASPVLH